MSAAEKAGALVLTQTMSANQSGDYTFYCLGICKLEAKDAKGTGTGAKEQNEEGEKDQSQRGGEQIATQSRWSIEQCLQLAVAATPCQDDVVAYQSADAR